MIVSQDFYSVPDPHVGMNEWPNPPWNATSYEWDAVYPERSPEWYAQTTAKLALAHGIQYAKYSDQYGRPASNPIEQIPAQVASVPDPRPGAASREDAIPVCNGVVNDTHLYMMRDGKLIKKPLGTIQHVWDLLQLCLENGLRALWVLAETELSDKATRDFIERPEIAQTWEIKNPQYAKSGRYEDGQERCTFLKAWKKKEARGQGENGRAVHLGYAEHNNRWDLDGVENPVQLLGALSYLEDALGMEVKYSPSSAGKHLMQSTNETKERSTWLVSVDLSQYPPVEQTRVIDVFWKRPLTERELGNSHFIAADKNSMYPASCTSVLLGTGEPEHRERPVFDMKKPLAGVYLCSITGTSDFNGVDLPHPTDGRTYGWFWTYTVKLLHEVGYTVDIEEAYVWPWERSHTILRPWAELLWNARASLDSKNPLCNSTRYPSKEARELAYNAVKPVLNMSIGLLAKQREYEGYAGATDLYRPDWNALIVDNARYQMFWRMRSFMKKGYTPIGVLADCLYYIVDTDDHIAALPGMFDRSDKLGGYKRKFKRAVTVAQVANMFNDPRSDIRDINKMLLDYDREKIEL